MLLWFHQFQVPYSNDSMMFIIDTDLCQQYGNSNFYRICFFFFQRKVQTSKKQFAVVSEDYGPDLHKYSLNHKDNWMYERYMDTQSQQNVMKIKKVMYIIIHLICVVTVIYFHGQEAHLRYGFTNLGELFFWDLGRIVHVLY